MSIINGKTNRNIPKSHLLTRSKSVENSVILAVPSRETLQNGSHLTSPECQKWNSSQARRLMSPIKLLNFFKIPSDRVLLISGHFGWLYQEFQFLKHQPMTRFRIWTISWTLRPVSARVQESLPTSRLRTPTLFSSANALSWSQEIVDCLIELLIVPCMMY